MIQPLLTFTIPDAHRAPLAGSNRLARNSQQHLTWGPENQVAASICHRLADAPARYSPLTLSGAPGTGKSSLASYVAAQWAQAHRGVSITSLTTRDFQSDRREPQQRSTVEWKAASSRLVIIEDLARFARFPSAQCRLARAVDDWRSERSQVLVTTRLAPGDILGLLPALRDRLAAGLLLVLNPPGREVRDRLIADLADEHGLTLDERTRAALAEALPTTVPEIRAAVAQLAAGAEGGLVTEKHVRQFAIAARHRGPNIATITRRTARHFSLTMSELRGPSRRRSIVAARGVAIYLARELTDKSLQTIGHYFGGRDHTTALHDFRQTVRRMQENPELQEAAHSLRAALITT